MSRISIFDDVIFSEEKLEGIEIQEIVINVGFQNASLSDLKRKMSAQATSLGANAIILFSYEQKRSFWSWDGIGLTGKGVAIKLFSGEYEILKKRTNIT